MTDRHILSIDQGTTSTRAIVFDEQGVPVGTSQREHKQIFDAPGWVSHDASEIWTNTVAVIDDAVRRSGIDAATIAGVGITNQRETTVVWNKRTGEPVDQAIVWQDTRTQEIIDGIADGDTQRFADLTGLPLATYFAASKVRWILDQHPEIRSGIESGDVVFGTIDSWLLWNLTGGVDGGVHATDVTNASRTLLMDVRSLKWADEALAAFDIPRSMLPEIKPSSGHFGTVAIDCSVTGVAICGILGDQQAAVFGQTAFNPGDTKNTYGTGNFVLVNTGTEPVRSSHGLITTLAYQIEGEPATYAVEGSIAVTGSLVQWLRDNLGIIRSSGEVEELALSVDDCGDVYFVPAFSGLFAPYWRPDARGIIVGLTRFVNRGHIARAALEATAFQTADVLRAVEADTGVAITELRVDGGMVLNNTLMQFQADILNVPVIRPAIAETTALGAAYAAGLAVGVWESLDQLRALWREDHRWTPDMQESDRAHALARWAKAIDHSLGWVS